MDIDYPEFVIIGVNIEFVFVFLFNKTWIFFNKQLGTFSFLKVLIISEVSKYYLFVL